MPEDHPDPQLLESFMRNEARREERRVIVRHLLAGCGECLRVTRRLWSLGESRLQLPDGAAADPPAASHGDAFSRLAAHGRRRADFALHGLAVHLAEAGRGEEAAMVLLDLALLYQREGRARELCRLAGELYPILRSGSLRPGTAVALLFFRDLVETGWATPEGLGAVHGFLAG